jgi:hypothetical protein
MAWITHQFDGYWFRIHAREDDNTATTIFCRHGNKTVAWLIFRYGMETTKARLTDSGDTILLYYPATVLGTIFDTLRSEKPLYVHMNPDIGWGYITSSVEPVGEEESNLMGGG